MLCVGMQSPRTQGIRWPEATTGPRAPCLRNGDPAQPRAKHRPAKLNRTGDCVEVKMRGGRVVFLGASLAALAVTNPAGAEGFALAAKAGTLGLGAELTV